MAATPRRTCVGCGSRAGRSELLRLARGPDGTVHLDARKVAPGRGAHVHPRTRCLEQAEGPRALGRAFRGAARSGGAGSLLSEAKGLGLVRDEAQRSGEASVDLSFASD